MKTLWDWAELLVIPMLVAFVIHHLGERQSEGEQLRAKVQREQDQREAERRIMDEALKSYLDVMQGLMLQHGLGAVALQNPVWLVARAHTLAILERMDGRRRAEVLQFLYDSGLLENSDSALNLDRANFQGAQLESVYLEGVKLEGANLHSANLSKAYLRGASFLFAKLQDADLSGAVLTACDFEGAEMARSNFFDANLHSANLSDADLDQAQIAQVQLDESATYRNAAHLAPHLNTDTRPYPRPGALNVRTGKTYP